MASAIKTDGDVPGLEWPFVDRGRVFHRQAANDPPGLVGVPGFEPGAPASRRRCSTKLSYTPLT